MFSKWASEKSLCCVVWVHVWVCERGRVHECLASACPFCRRLSHLPAGGGGGRWRCYHMYCCARRACTHACVCVRARVRQITCVGVKRCSIFTSCCSSLLIDAPQPSGLGPFGRSPPAGCEQPPLTYLGVGGRNVRWAELVFFPPLVRRL